MNDRLIQTLLTVLMAIGLPIVNTYISLCDHPFFCVRVADVKGLEAAGNLLLVPTQYLFSGKKAVETGCQQVPYTFVQDFDYRGRWLFKTTGAILTLPASLLYGGLIKAVAFVNSDTRERYRKLLLSRKSKAIFSNNAYYKSLGLEIEGDKASITPPSYKRGPRNDLHMSEEMAALTAITDILRKENIPFWLDCGTCLGAYRYGGIIPWDHDIDIAILEPDSANVRRALGALDSSRFIVQDWSSRDKPDTQLKVYIKNSSLSGSIALIDIYHYAINEKERTLDYIFSAEENIFFPPDKRRQEIRFKTPAPFEMVFPLKKVIFDGIEAWVPNNTKEYLHLRYGSDLRPSKIYNETLGIYERIEDHPYWKS